MNSDIDQLITKYMVRAVARIERADCEKITTVCSAIRGPDIHRNLAARIPAARLGGAIEVRPINQW